MGSGLSATILLVASGMTLASYYNPLSATQVPKGDCNKHANGPLPAYPPSI
jgi:hypothetical protein